MVNQIVWATYFSIMFQYFSTSFPCHLFILFLPSVYLFPYHIFLISLSFLYPHLFDFSLPSLYLYLILSLSSFCPFNVITLPFSCHHFTLTLPSLSPFIVISSPFQCHHFTLSLSSIYPFFFFFLVQSLLLSCQIFTTPSLSNLCSFFV